MRRSVEIIGTRFVDQPFEDALAQLSRALDKPGTRVVYFANAATLNLAAEDEGYRRTLNAADYLYGDGTGVRWAASLRGVRLQSNLNGTDVIPALLERRPGVRVYLLGGSETLIRRTVARFAELFPEVVLAGWHDGYFDHNASGPVIEEINAVAPDLLLVGFGNPLQERWIEANKAQLRVPLVAGVGGLFGFWAGTRKRAPRLVRRLGMEWAHILLEEPHKAKRYLLGNPLFIWRMFAWLRADRTDRAGAF